MKRNKSAKDIAFDKERKKYNHEINNLKITIQNQLSEIYKLNERIQELQESVRQKDEWIDRLLEYTELTKEDLQRKIRNEKNIFEVSDAINQMENIIDRIGFKFGL